MRDAFKKISRSIIQVPLFIITNTFHVQKSVITHWNHCPDFGQNGKIDSKIIILHYSRLLGLYSQTFAKGIQIVRLRLSSEAIRPHLQLRAQYSYRIRISLVLFLFTTCVRIIHFGIKWL